ncbi:excalibur calcium-binding domain-containing protein [Stackebrandtia soli]|uniref:excalibur calcium-binding domain-containing protein n=1 Tax=Stackebrandtia soli TaxID=1892856 RepID=UPI0039E79B6A
MNKRAITTVGIAIVLAAGATSCGGGGGSPYDEDPATSEPMTDEESGPETGYSSLSESPSSSATTSPSGTPSIPGGDGDPDPDERRPPNEEEEPDEESTEGEDDTAYYPNCAAARAAGAAPLFAGSPGYRLELDRDKDGVACE